MALREPELFITTSRQDEAAVEFLNGLFREAIERNARDVHMLFEGDICYIDFRIGKDLERFGIVSDEDYSAGFLRQIDEKIRNRAQFNSADRHIALDGRMSLSYPETNYRFDIRVSLIPTHQGFSFDFRLLKTNNESRRLDCINMSGMVRHAIMTMIEEPQGLFLVSGPTGSGKTTLLYAILAQLHNGKRQILTVENPVEYSMPGIVQVNVTHHLGFERALESFLRHDPDIILVGEIRDAITAKIAVQAANTGHLVLATVHANNSALAVTRMLDFGVDPQTFAGALRAVTAQRLVATYEPDELELRIPQETEMEWLQNHGIRHKPDVPLPFSIPGTKESGYTPLIEMIVGDSRVREAIESRSGEVAVFNAAVQQPQFETLARASMRLARQGIVSVNDVMHAIGADAMVPTSKPIWHEFVESGEATEEEVFVALEEQTALRAQGYVTSLASILARRHQK